MLERSIEHHRLGRFGEAEQGYRARLADQPDDVEALQLLGMLRYQLGDSDEGRRLLERARELAPEHPGVILTLASMRFRDGDHEGARRGFHEALAFDPNLAGAHAGLGQLALMREERDKAEQHFRVALRAAEEPHALAGLGSLLLERGDAEGALRHLGRAAELAPDDAMIQMSLGQAFARRNTPAFAEQAFRNALRLRPDLHAARHWLGSLLIRERRIAEAEEQYRALLPIDGFELTALLGLGDAARADQRFDEAASAYRAVLAREPAHAVAARALAWSLAQVGRHDEAIATYDAALERSPGDDELRSARADLLTLVGRFPQAAAGWRELIERNPANLFARSRLAIVSEYLGEVGEAQAHAELALQAQDDPEMQLVRVRALLRAGEFDAAHAALDALAQHPLSAGQRRLRSNYLGRVHDRRGEPVEAVRCFVEAQAGVAAAVPPLADPRPELEAALAEPAGEPWADAPVLLLGTPGSGVERVAALLADQPGLLVLRDRLDARSRADGFSQPNFQAWCGELDPAARAALRERWQAPLRGVDIGGRTVVDWLPRWDAHQLALVRRAMPGTRIVVVERDPRDALLNWLAFGWAPGFPCGDLEGAVAWLARARRHLQHGLALDDPRHLVVAADPLLDGRAGAGDELARFLGLAAIEPGRHAQSMAIGLGGLPVRFPAGHWKNYREALSGEFAQLMH